MSKSSDPVTSLYALQALAKGFSVFYFVLLPLFFAQRLIDSTQLGYIGALFIAMLIVGALVVARALHKLEVKNLLQISSLIAIAASLGLLVSSLINSLPILIAAYGVMGFGVGLATSGVNALAAQLTKKGDRYKSLAQLGMLTDIVRIVFPLIVAAAVGLGASSAAIGVIILAAVIFLFLSSSIPEFHSEKTLSVPQNIGSLRKNTNFLYALSLEFLDSFSSSQLFVFLPLIFLAKGYSLESSLIFQSFIFGGYLSGRWLVSFLAKRFSGIKAIGLAEVGMVFSIVLLLIVKDVWMLYVLTFALGVFARGTSPAIKAVAFDTLEDSQMKKGSALHVVSGDSGSAIGQLFFGLLVAWYGVNSPFVVAAFVAGLIAVACFVKPIRTNS